MTRQGTGLTKATIARNLDAAIAATGKTNREIGEAIGATEHQVWRWRRGKVQPSDRYITALSHLLFDGDRGALYVDGPNGDTTSSEAAA